MVDARRDGRLPMNHCTTVICCMSVLWAYPCVGRDAHVNGSFRYSGTYRASDNHSAPSGSFWNSNHMRPDLMPNSARLGSWRDLADRVAYDFSAAGTGPMAGAIPLRWYGGREDQFGTGSRTVSAVGGTHGWRQSRLQSFPTRRHLHQLPKQFADLEYLPEAQINESSTTNSTTLRIDRPGFRRSTTRSMLGIQGRPLGGLDRLRHRHHWRDPLYELSLQESHERLRTLGVLSPDSSGR